MDPALLEPVTRAVRMIFLNKTCFNGLYRTNKKGQFNSPWGKEENASICDGANISACAEVLRRVDSTLDGLTIQHKPWWQEVSQAQPGDLVYFDPPYVPVSDTASFTGYTSEGFPEAEQRALAKSFSELAERGVAVVLSNSDTPLVRELYEGWEIHEVKMGRSINSDGAKREAVGEVVVVGRRDGLTPFISEHQEDPFAYMNALMEEF
jgi:DNA adenine methylase